MATRRPGPSSNLDIAEAHLENDFPLKVGLAGDARATLEYMVELIRAARRQSQASPTAARRAGWNCTAR